MFTKCLSIFRPYIVFVEWTKTLLDRFFHFTCASVAKIVISKMLARFWPKISILSLKILFDIIIGHIVYYILINLCNKQSHKFVVKLIEINEKLGCGLHLVAYEMLTNTFWHKNNDHWFRGWGWTWFLNPFVSNPA